MRGEGGGDEMGGVIRGVIRGDKGGETGDVMRGKCMYAMCVLCMA